MKVAIVLPNITKKFKLMDEEISLSLAYLGTVLQNHHELMLIDAFSSNYSVEQVLDKLKEFKPDILGISLMFDSMFIYGNSLIQEARSLFHGIKIIGGGPYATLNSKELISKNLFDIIVLHEAEVTIVELLNLLSKDLNPSSNKLMEIDGLCFFTTDGNLCYTKPRALIEDIDTIPFPNRHLIHGVEKGNLKRINILSSRGCGYGCIYCSTDKMWKSKWRGRSAENIVAEIMQFPELERVSFVDDNFTINKNRLVDFCQLLLSKNLNITWGCSSRAEGLNDELIDLMSKSGCRQLFLGVETGSERMLNILKRKYTKEDIIHLTERCLERGIIVQASFMIGLPYERVEDIQETMDLIEKIKTFLCSIHVFTPRIGTPSFDNPDKYDLTIHKKETYSIADDVQGVVSTSELSVEEINQWYLKATGLTFRKARQKDHYLSLIKQ